MEVQDVKCKYYSPLFYIITTMQFGINFSVQTLYYHLQWSRSIIAPLVIVFNNLHLKIPNTLEEAVGNRSLEDT